MAWGDAMGLGGEYLSPPARFSYPPPSLAAAAELSRSARVARMWRDADALPEALCAGGGGGGGACRLPEWAAPFPNGQLSSFDRMGRYADNIERWLAHFPRECFVFVHLDELAANPSAVLDEIARRCEQLLQLPPQWADRAPHGAAKAGGGAEAGAAAAPVVAPRLNASAELRPQLEPDASLLGELATYYRPHNERLFRLIGRDLGWHSSPEYPWYRAPSGGAT